MTNASTLSLPLFAQMAVERLAADNALRNSHTLDALLDSYAKSTGAACDEAMRESVQLLCGRRFGVSFQVVGIGIRL